MISLRSAEVCFSPRSLGSTPNRRTIAFEALFSAQVNGALSARKALKGRDRARAVGSERVIASIFGTCSPIVMWSAVATAKAIAKAIACAPVPSPIRGSIRSAIAGSPRKPIPIEARVIPNWHAASDSSILSSCSSACSAPASPRFASSSIRPLRVRTRANSAATKSPLIRTSAISRTRKRAVTAQGDAGVLRGRSSSIQGPGKGSSHRAPRRPAVSSARWTRARRRTWTLSSSTPSASRAAFTSPAIREARVPTRR